MTILRIFLVFKFLSRNEEKTNFPQEERGIFEEFLNLNLEYKYFTSSNWIVDTSAFKNFFKLAVMVFWFSMMPLIHKIPSKIFPQAKKVKKTLYFNSKIFPKSLILGWSIPRFSRLFSSRGIPRHQIPRFLVSHEEILSVSLLPMYLDSRYVCNCMYVLKKIQSRH